MQENIEHISDTAFWIAGYRAQESERPDAVFNDYLAGALAGQRGLDMVATTPHTRAMAFAMVVRTSAIDRLIESAIAKEIDTVINIAAGLDTRPYRMNLPSSLRWIEADLPSVIEYKEKKLQNERPGCQLERISVDLSKPEERKLLFSNIEQKSMKALVITEGLIGYLTTEQAEELSKNIYNCSSARYWIQDYRRGKLRRNRHSKDLEKKLKRTPLQFDVAEPIPFFEKQGWRVEENIFILDEADRIGRKLPLLFPWSMLMVLLPGLIRKLGNRTYGYVMFGRS